MAVAIEAAARIVPSSRQLEWQRMEFYAFIHVGINTFTDCGNDRTYISLQAS